MRIIYIITIVFFISFSSKGQTYEYGKVSVEELSMKSDPVFPEANAVILHREEKTNVGYHREFYQRIKIFNEEGYDDATFIIPPGEYKLEGATYTLVDGKVVKTDLPKDQVFKDEVVKDVKIKRLTFPNLSPGCVIELFYKTDVGTDSDLYLQMPIPIRQVSLEITNRTRIKYSIVQNPRAFLNVIRNEDGASTKIKARDVPALEDESFVYDIDMYRAKIMMKLTGVQDLLKLSSLKDIVISLYEDDDFGRQVVPKSVYKKEIQAIVGEETNQLEQAKLIYEFVKEDIEWNNRIGFVPRNGTRETFRKKEGNIADINLMYISMLRSLDIPAYPVLASTKSNGVPLNPTIESFNYLMAGVKYGGKTYLVDAGSTKATFEKIPKHLLNWQGALIKKSGEIQWQDLTRPTFSDANVMAQVTIDEDLNSTGSATEMNTGYFEIQLRNQVKDGSENDREDLVSHQASGLEVSNIEVDQSTKGRFNISYDFETETGVEAIGDKIYISPLFYLGLSENPFKKDSRMFPIDFGFPMRRQHLISFNIPEGYEVESLPEGIMMSLPQEIGSFSYQISASNGMIQVRTKSQINIFVLPAEIHLDLKQFYSARMDKESEKVVLRKIKETTSAEE